MSECLKSVEVVADYAEDPRLPRLESSLRFLEIASQNPETAFGGNPRIVNFSSTSRHKQFAALDPEILKKGLIPILSPIPSLFGPSEIDLRTGGVDRADFVDALFALYPVPPAELYVTNWFELSLGIQAEIIARFKACYDDNAKKGDLILATDSLGRLRYPGEDEETRYDPLGKTKDLQEQRLALQAMAQNAVIEGAVGCSVGRRTGDNKLSSFDYDFTATSAGHVDFEVHLRTMTDPEIDQYIKDGQKEIRGSGLVVSVFGPVCQAMELVESIKIDQGKGLQEVSLEQAWPIIAGYPADLILSLLNKYPPDDQSRLDERLGLAIREMKYLQYVLESRISF